MFCVRSVTELLIFPNITLKLTNPQHYTQDTCQKRLELPALDDLGGWVRLTSNLTIRVCTSLALHKVPTEYNRQKRISSLANIYSIYGILRATHHPENYQGNPSKVAHIGSGWSVRPILSLAIALGVTVQTVIRQLSLLGHLFFHQWQVK
ncbi:MAG TPA: hypothetical protein VIQ31_02875, partial [Phormidium sp.]